MTPPRTWCLAITVLLSVLPTISEVVKSMSDCDQFLLEGIPPQVPGILEGGKILNQNRYKSICQTYNNTRKFVTLYDINNKIPVFSANKYRGEEERRRPRNIWKIEPQPNQIFLCPFNFNIGSFYYIYTTYNIWPSHDNIWPYEINTWSSQIYMRFTNT
ncbi:uncharacterized protein AKAME5_001942100 [Lates japonicus]|uniref:Uncharacterized protein n=1 Tax=Lates japonicus TaxID=270547 RepID=A0AAD3RGR8_LATJO|nr:uncharacterized protein AKAME5_001942100 [Lates japonicus]